MSFSKNRSGVPFLRTDMPRVLMPGESDATSAVEKQEAFAMIQQTMEEIMARHNTAFLNTIRQMMVGVFGADAKCAPSAKHTASRTSWLHTCRESQDVPVNFP
jgi:hypothetical protein